ncbi:MAG: serine hydroxymethyltransferase [Candidatus Babeliaceae bacterium]
MLNPLSKVDPEISRLIEQETQREELEINLIASENYVPQALLQAVGSLLTNKYAEGYPGKRYYGGCEYVDKIETLAIERCKKLFNAEHANVQPHAGSQANMTVYAALLQPGDTIMGMSLAHGGHLTHGHSVNFSGMLYKSISYTVNRETELIDYDALERLAQEHKPKLIIAGASAYSRTIDFKRFAEIAHSVSAYFMADIAHIAGLIAAGLHPSPLDYADCVTSTTHKTLRGPRGGFIMCKNTYKEAIDRAIMPGLQGGPLMHIIAAKATAFQLASQPDFLLYQQQVISNAQALAHIFNELGYRLVTGGTDNHLFMLDLRAHNITGLQAEKTLEKAGISVSRSCIPFDSQKPWITSGIRLGTPAVTTRGMQEKEMHCIAQLIHEALKKHDNEASLKMIKEKAQQLGKEFPIYQ